MSLRLCLLSILKHHYARMLLRLLKTMCLCPAVTAPEPEKKEEAPAPAPIVVPTVNEPIEDDEAGNKQKSPSPSPQTPASNKEMPKKSKSPQPYRKQPTTIFEHEEGRYCAWNGNDNGLLIMRMRVCDGVLRSLKTGINYESSIWIN